MDMIKKRFTCCWVLALLCLFLLFPPVLQGMLGAQSTVVDTPSGAASDIILNSRMDISRIKTFAGWIPTPATTAMVSADFNEDGWPDLATTDQLSSPALGSVTVYFGNGQGTFRDPSTLAVGSSPQSLAAADLNGDLYMDIITANGVPNNTLSVWLGIGEGKFVRGPDSAIGATPSGITIGDFDGDGAPDAVTAIPNARAIRIQLGRGDGTFAQSTEFSTGHRPTQILACDFNHDDRLDVVTISASTELSGSVCRLVGMGDSSFQSFRLATFSGPFYSLTGGVLINDRGWTDLVVGARQGTEGRLVVYQSREPDKEFHFTQLPPISAPGIPSAIAIQDMNLDNHQDLVVAIATSAGNTFRGVAVYYGDGQGNFVQPTGLQSLFPSGGTPHALITGRFNPDDYPDAAVANTPFPDTDQGNLSLLWGTGSGTFFFPFSADVEEGFREPGERSRPRALAGADFNQDQYMDLSIVNAERDTVSIMSGTANGLFQTVSSFSVRDPQDPFSRHRPEALVTADFDNDGLTDVVALNAFRDSITFFASLGEGNFGPPLVTSFLRAPIRLPVALAAGDFDLDGNLDLVVVNESSSELIILDGGGDGTFTPRFDATLGLASNATAVRTYDFDGDEILDLVMTTDPSANFGQLWILKGIGDGTFCRAGIQDGELCCAAGACFDFNPIRLINQYGATDVAVLRFPSDESVYLAVANFRSRTLSILAPLAGGFSLRPAIPLSGRPSALLAVDLDQDGEPELVVVNQTSHNLTVFRRIGAGFTPQSMDWGVGPVPRSILSGDFNKDGWPDLVTVHYDDDTIAVLLNGTQRK